MTRDDAIALLELMKRETRSEAGVPPLDSQSTARRYVRIMSQLNGRDSCGAGENWRGHTARRSC